MLKLQKKENRDVIQRYDFDIRTDNFLKPTLETKLAVTLAGLLTFISVNAENH